MSDMVGFISIGVLIVVNIAVAAFSFGKLNQRVSALCWRLTKVEKQVERHGEARHTGRD